MTCTVQLSLPPLSKPSVIVNMHLTNRSIGQLVLYGPRVYQTHNIREATNTTPLARARCLLVHKTNNSTFTTRPEPTPTTNTLELPWTTWREVSPNYEHSCFFTCNHETKSQRCGLEMRLFFHDHIVEMLNPFASLEFTWHLWWFWHSVSMQTWNIPWGRATKPPIPSSTTVEAQIAEAIKACSSLEEAENAPVKWAGNIVRSWQEKIATIYWVMRPCGYQHALEMTKIFSERCSLCSKMSLRRRRQFVFPNYLLMSQ